MDKNFKLVEKKEKKYLKNNDKINKFYLFIFIKKKYKFNLK